MPSQENQVHGCPQSLLGALGKPCFHFWVLLQELINLSFPCPSMDLSRVFVHSAGPHHPADASQTAPMREHRRSGVLEFPIDGCCARAPTTSPGASVVSSFFSLRSNGNGACIIGASRCLAGTRNTVEHDTDGGIRSDPYNGRAPVLCFGDGGINACRNASRA